MIPLWLVVKVEVSGHRRLHLRLPLFLLWLLVLPLALVLAPLLALLCLIRGIHPIELFCALLGVFAGISGTHVEVQHARASVLIRVV